MRLGKIRIGKVGIFLQCGGVVLCVGVVEILRVSDYRKGIYVITLSVIAVSSLTFYKGVWSFFEPISLGNG